MPRVHELAKQLNKNSKDIIEKCKELGIDASSHMNVLSDDDAARILRRFSGGTDSKGTKIEGERINATRTGAEETVTKRETVPAGTSENAAAAQINAAATVANERKSSGEENDLRRMRSRPEGEERPRRARPEGEERPRRPRPEGEERPRRPRPEGEERPRRPRPEGEERPRRPRTEGEERPRRPRPEGEERPRRPRPEGEERPRRPRPEGEERPRKPRPEGEERPRRPRPEGEERPRRPRPEGEDRAERPERTERIERAEITERQERTERPNRVEKPQHSGDTSDRQAKPRNDNYQRRAPRPYTGEITEQRPAPQRTDRRPEQRPAGGQRQPNEGGFRQQGFQKDGFNKGGFQRQGGPGRPQGGPGRPQGGPGRPQGGPGRPQRPGQAGGPVKLQQMTKPDSRSPRNDNFKKDRNDKDKRLGDDIAKLSQKPGSKQSRQQKPGARGAAKQKPMPPKEEKIEITMATIPANITVKNFAEAIGKNTSLIIKTLMKNGVMANLNQEIEFETAAKIGEQLNVLIDLEEEKDLLEEAFREEPDSEKDLVERPPVVVVMGHVDHGKTSLLDAIRDASVQTSEAGGITQHIGAYTTKINNRSITFLDTPGHEAFTAMRMRGASITDIAILVVAADDGVMPQTIEAINHAKAAGVEIIVAINKIDKPSSNPDRVKQELTEYGLLVEEWGGETVCVPVSALKKIGLDKLLEMILLVADIKELKANPNKRAKGTVVEALLDKGRGPVATVLIQEGTLHVGDSIVAGSCYGKVRAMMDDKGKRVKKAGPSKPVEIIGLSEAPKAGDALYAAENDRQARQITEMLIAKDRVDMTRASAQKISLDDLFNQIKAGNVKELNIVIKADVQGSVEAVRQSLERLSNDEVKIKTIHGGVGAVTESDVMLAAASNAIIIGFNVRPEATAKSVADTQNVDIRLYRVIYNAIEDINAAIKGMLEPIYEEKVIGHAEIRQVFKASGVGSIGGSYVQDGKFIRNGKVRIMRDSSVIYEGELESLKRFKDDVKEVAAGYECGLLFNKFNDIKEGDIVEAYVMEEIER